MREFEIMRYPVRLVSAPEGGYVVSFPDIPEALTQGETRQQSLDTALEALVTASLSRYLRR